MSGASDRESADGAEGDITLSSVLFDRLFPYHLVIDRQMQIVRAGSVVQRIVPELAPPVPFMGWFTVRRPVTELTFDALAAKAHTIFVLAAVTPADFMLRGEIVPVGPDTVAFLGAPLINTIESFKRFNLTARDLPAHDPTADMLTLLQTQKTALDDAQKLARDLSVARDTALRASKVKSEFLANMSHEFRTPLNAIIGFSELLAMQALGPLPKPYPEYAENIRASGAMLLELVNDLLDLSRLESGQYELSERPFAVAPTLQECVGFVSAEAKRKSLDLALDVGPAGLGLRADERAFKQIVLNLLSNAVKFTDDGGSVRVAALREPDALAVTVADSGIGIAAEVLPQLFEPFRQADTSITRKYGGSGLGLSICRKLVDMHGGQIGLDSALGVGTTATVRFPTQRIIEDFVPTGET